MKTFIGEIIPKIQRFSKKLDDLTLLTNQHWVSISDILNKKTVYIFRPNKQLLISENGVVQKGCWEYLGNQSLLIDTNKQSYLLKHGFFDENVIALKFDSSEKFVFFVNEAKFDNELNNIDDILIFLESKYLINASINNTNPKTKFAKKDKLGNIIIPNYLEAEPVEHYQLFESNFYTIIVSFQDNISGTIFKCKNDNKYYFSGLEGDKFFNNKATCIKELYINIVQNQ